MEKKAALESLSALAHDIRLDVLRLLVRAGPPGLTAGEIAAALEVPAVDDHVTGDEKPCSALAPATVELDEARVAAVVAGG